MTTKPPPKFYFSTLIFNSDYYTITENTTITREDADKRYLIKVTQDTSTFKQSFTSGIDSTSINLSSLNNLIIGDITNDVGQTSSINTSTINIGANYTSSESGNKNINIGSLTSIAPAINQFINLNKPLTIKYGTVFSFTQIGGTFSAPIPLTLVATTNNTSTNLFTIGSVPKGLYLFSYQINYSNATAITVLTKQEYGLSYVASSLLPTDIITQLYESNYCSESIIVSPTTDEYVKSHYNTGTILLTSATHDISLVYRIAKTGTGVLKIAPYFRITRIG
jgi:hypothetical protein